MDDAVADNAKQGFVYLLHSTAMPSIYKIGSTTRNPYVRCLELSSLTAVPTPYILVSAVFMKDVVLAEKNIHDALADKRVNNSREFFRFDDHVDAVEQFHNKIFEMENLVDPLTSLTDLMSFGSGEDMIFSRKKYIEEIKKKHKEIDECRENSVEALREVFRELHRLKISHASEMSVLRQEWGKHPETIKLTNEISKLSADLLETREKVQEVKSEAQKIEYKYCSERARHYHPSLGPDISVLDNVLNFIRRNPNARVERLAMILEGLGYSTGKESLN